jgi:transcriptional regulator with XRE-family HTH domain
MRTLLEIANRIPPCKCRAIARKNRGMKLKTHDDIAAECGLSRRTVMRYSRMKDWNSIPFEMAQKFANACGVNHLSPSKQIRFLRHGKTMFLRNARPKQRVMLKKLMSG